MDIKAVHEAIKELITEAGVVQVQHTYINNACGEHWSAAIYREAAEGSELDCCMFQAHLQPTSAAVFAEVRRLHANYDPEAHRAAEIAKLKRQLAQLEGGGV